MVGNTPFCVGLIIRSLAYGHRSARSQLDLAMLAASLDFELRLYFIGAAVLQLTPRTEIRSALLPAGYRAWASLPELMEQRELKAFAEPGWLKKLLHNEIEPCLELRPAPAAQMRQDWADCDQVLVL